jgi:hypothetical protein
MLAIPRDVGLAVYGVFQVRRTAGAGTGNCVDAQAGKGRWLCATSLSRIEANSARKIVI